jgi:transposase InsO family protein
MFMCRMLGVSASGFYASQKRPESTHTVRDRVLTVLAQDAHRKGRGVYGSPRVHAVLAAAGHHVGKKRVARLMRAANITVRRRRRFVRTTDSNHANPIAPNVLNRDFTTDAPNKAWVTDITYIPTREGWLYLAVILDLFSRRVVGWAMAATMEKSLVLDALKMALRQRQPPASLTHHSDRGSQYASADYRLELKTHGIVCSMSRKGNCWDNAVAESFFGGLKKEFVHDEEFETREKAKSGLFEWLEVFYNRQRLHSTLDYMTPEQYEQAQLLAPKAA